MSLLSIHFSLCCISYLSFQVHTIKVSLIFQKLFFTLSHFRSIPLPLCHPSPWKGSHCLHHFLNLYLPFNCSNLASALTTDTRIRQSLFTSMFNHSSFSGFGVYRIFACSDTVGYPHLHENLPFVSVVSLPSLSQFHLSLIYRHQVLILCLMCTFSSRTAFGPHPILHTLPRWPYFLPSLQLTQFNGDSQLCILTCLLDSSSKFLTTYCALIAYHLPILLPQSSGQICPTSWSVHCWLQYHQCSAISS